MLSIQKGLQTRQSAMFAPYQLYSWPREDLIPNATKYVQPCFTTLICCNYLGTNPLDMEATLTAPSGKSELCEIRDLPASLYDIKFSPWEDGVHTVSLKYKGLHISGKILKSSLTR